MKRSIKRPIKKLLHPCHFDKCLPISISDLVSNRFQDRIMSIIIENILWVHHRRPQEFFRGERPGHLKTITRPRRGSGGGAKAPPDGSEVSFFQTMQSIRKRIHFSKISTFFLTEKSIFLIKISKNWTYFTRIFPISGGGVPAFPPPSRRYCT